MVKRATILGLFLIAVPVLHAGEVLDGVAVTVNGHVILQSDWQDEVRYECFVAGRALKTVTPQDRKAALNRLIDQELLREQMGSAEFKPASAEEIDTQLEAVKNDYARDHGAQAWTSALALYHLTDVDIKNHIGLELSQLRLVDAHLRPAIQVEVVEVEAYYKDHLASSAAGSQQTSLQQATPKIRELLTQQKMDQLLTSWLEGLHSQAQIRIFVPDSAEIQGPAQ